MIDTSLIKSFSEKVIAPSLVIFGLICFFNEEIFNKILENNFISIIIFLPIVGATYIFEKIFIYLFEKFKKYELEKEEKTKKINRIKQNKEDFKKLEQDKKNILWSVFFKTKEGFFAYEIRDLVKTLYLNVTTSLTKKDLSFYIVELPKEIESFLEEEYNRIICEYLQSLNDNEKSIMTLFVEYSDEETYNHPWITNEQYSCLYQLREKKLISFNDKDNVYIELNEYTIKNFKSFIDKEIQRKKINIDLNNVESSLLTLRVKK